MKTLLIPIMMLAQVATAESFTCIDEDENRVRITGEFEESAALGMIHYADGFGAISYSDVQFSKHFGSALYINIADEGRSKLQLYIVKYFGESQGPLRGVFVGPLGDSLLSCVRFDSSASR